MARPIKGKHTLCRRVGEKLCGLDKCPSGKRPFARGVHGANNRRRLTGYGIQLQEKQKAKVIYGLMEHQFRSYVEKAIASRGNTSDTLLTSLETRLDNVVYRLGFARTRWQSRQMVSHGHFTVNGRKVTIPSIRVRVDDVIAVRPQLAKSKLYEGMAEKLALVELPPWLNMDAESLSAKIIAMPNAVDAKPLFDTKAIVEYYSR